MGHQGTATWMGRIHRNNRKKELLPQNSPTPCLLGATVPQSTLNPELSISHTLMPHPDVQKANRQRRPVSIPDTVHPYSVLQLSSPVRFSSGNQHSTTAAPVGRPYLINSPAFMPVFVSLTSTHLRLSSGSKWLPHRVSFLFVPMTSPSRGPSLDENRPDPSSRLLGAS